MSVRRLLIAIVTFACGIALPVAAAAQDKPNFVIILADDLGYGDVGFQGGQAKTPHLDKLAAEGIRLTAHYVHPMCSPTRAALLTGQYASRFGVTGAQNEQAFPFGTPTIASVLSGAGYDTALIGKWHLGSGLDTPPNKFGFGYSYGLLAGGATPDTHEYKMGPHQRTWHRNGTLLDEEGHITDLITKDAVKWIDERTDKPFFLYVPYTAVHVPINEPEQWLKMNEHITDPAKRLHAADVSHLDDGVGQILAALEKKNLRQNTVVLFLSDNGAHDDVDNKQDKYPGIDTRPHLTIRGSNAPFRGWKGSVYEGGIRTPAIAHWPGHWENGVQNAPVSVTGWFTTFCYLGGVELPRTSQGDGEYLNPMLASHAKKSPLEPLPVYSASPGYRARMVRVGKWKLIITKGTTSKDKDNNKAKADVRELYNLDTDPGESRNVIAEHPEEAANLEKVLAEFAAGDKVVERGGKAVD
ncbi:sulfatase-like hydrolase/transferase [Roseimicrobium sp. ORNL1]|uniref:sulfatase-like hydrolase/transferase n=1 Tax=Roseimicrobium sp. ORNL1 TaxID=2711231 RepID=UPI0013E16797|nr:sulfatase-like hydrolase/transferase [Roseimicrobium sp. ORNL1]QIF00186.1 sulfatase-like hydrolase/transferase [Roseimicrobium sp. ORNL1]